MSEPTRLTITAAPSAMPAVVVQRRLYDAVECLRIAASRIETFIDDPGRTENKEGIDDNFLFAVQTTARLYISVFQEMFGGVTPSVPDRVFQVIRGFENRWPESTPGIEGIVLALSLAVRSLDAAVAAGNDEYDELDDLMDAAANVTSLHRDFLSNLAHMFHPGEIVNLILTDEELPPVQTQADVDEWRRECQQRRRANRIAAA